MKQSYLKKKSISLYGHKTSLALEPLFWDTLENIAKNENISLKKLVETYDKNRDSHHSLSSTLRVKTLEYILNNKLR